MAEKKKIVKKVISRIPVTKETQEVKEETTEAVETQKEVRSKKVCQFCQNKTNPSYTDLAVLRRFLSDRAKIQPRARSGVCSKHQRGVAKNIKYARHLALLPFVPKV